MFLFRIHVLFFSIHLFFSIVYAQPVNTRSANAGEIQLKMKHLNQFGSVLYVAAHPDDENTRMISWLALERGYQTAYLSYTRGDGGQNLVGSEQALELGMIRTQELLAARNIDGGNQYFSSACDFGFSKNPEETFSIWNRQKLLEETVWLIRTLRPDVIITRFTPEPSATHGHHTASAQLALEAFFAAGDPEMFPEQLRKADVWQPKRIFWNTSWFFYGTRDYDKSGLLKVETGTFIPQLGQSVGEIAAESRSQHRSQGFGSARQRGEEPEYLKPLAGEKATSDIMDGIETGWKRLSGTEFIEARLKNVIKTYNPANPVESVPGLMEIRTELKKLNPSFWRETKIRQTEELILDCSGFFSEALISKSVNTPDDSLALSIESIIRSPARVLVGRVFFNNDYLLEENRVLSQNILQKTKWVIPPAIEEDFSHPFWFKNDKTQGMFNAGSPEQAVKASETDRWRVVMEVYVNNDVDPIQVSLPIIYKYTEPDRGELFKYPELVPPLSVVPKSSLIIMKKGFSTFCEVKIVSNDKLPKKGKLTIEKTDGISIFPENVEFELEGVGIEKVFRFQVSGTSGKLYPKVELNGKTYDKSIKRISHTHIPDLILQQSAEINVSVADVKTSSISIGYIQGAGDDIPQVLRELGYKVDILSETDLEFSTLKKYNTVIAGVRAFNTQSILAVKHGELMKYVESGGKYIVQYNTSNSLLTDKIGPFPFKITRTRITVEESPLEMLIPLHPLFSKPNKITSSDFENWVQERGLYFIGESDKSYNRLLSGSDPGEEVSNGILLETRYGKGQFIYTGLSFFRQLPAGNPGAIRLFVNLIESRW